MALWTGAWLIVLGLLIYPATRRGSSWRIAGLIGLVIGPLLLSDGALGWYHYPEDAEFAPLARQAVIVGPDVVLHTDAARTSPEVIDAPPGSLAEVLKLSGRWAYVALRRRHAAGSRPARSKWSFPRASRNRRRLKKSAGDGSSA